MKNKNKYKRESTVFGILTAVFFAVMVVFYCVFSKVDVEEKKELAAVIAFVVVGSFVLFLCFSVLFIVFNILRSSYMKKVMRETNQFEKLEMHKVFLNFPNFLGNQNLSLSALADLIRASLSFPSCGDQSSGMERKFLLPGSRRAVLFWTAAK